MSWDRWEPWVLLLSAIAIACGVLAIVLGSS